MTRPSIFAVELPRDCIQFVRVESAIIAVHPTKQPLVIEGGNVTVLAPMSRRTWYYRQAEKRAEYIADITKKYGAENPWVKAQVAKLMPRRRKAEQRKAEGK